MVRGRLLFLFSPTGFSCILYARPALSFRKINGCEWQEIETIHTGLCFVDSQCYHTFENDLYLYANTLFSISICSFTAIRLFLIAFLRFAYFFFKHSCAYVVRHRSPHLLIFEARPFTFLRHDSNCGKAAGERVSIFHQHTTWYVKKNVVTRYKNMTCLPSLSSC